MSESTRTTRAPADKRLTYQQWKRRKMLRLARNWVLFLAGCAAVVALLTGGLRLSSLFYGDGRRFLLPL